MRAEPLAGSAVGLGGEDFVLVQWTAEVGNHWIAPLHVHHEDDEAWYVLQGRLGFRLGEATFEVGPGGAVLARRGVVHTWWNAGDGEAEYLLVMTPRIASLVAALHKPGTDAAALFAAHASEIVIPE
jgi:quercetin dioxygenase-like cupin family protein